MARRCLPHHLKRWAVEPMVSERLLGRPDLASGQPAWAALASAPRPDRGVAELALALHPRQHLDPVVERLAWALHPRPPVPGRLAVARLAWTLHPRPRVPGRLAVARLT
jgi:hypothetical protein